MSRKNRGLSQNLFLIETIPTEDPFTKKFAVMGTTGNVYEVTISTTPDCSCPDFLTRGIRCKHIYFILLKVMKVETEIKHGFTKDDLMKMFKNIPNVTSSLIVNENLRGLYKKKTGIKEDNVCSLEEDGTVKKQSIKDEICPICLEMLEDGNKLDYCKKGCGKSIHEKCFSMWKIKNKSTCVFCRVEWEDPDNTQEDTGYINLMGNTSASIPTNNQNFNLYDKKWQRRYLDINDFDSSGEEGGDFDMFNQSYLSGEEEEEWDEEGFYDEFSHKSRGSDSDSSSSEVPDTRHDSTNSRSNIKKKSKSEIKNMKTNLVLSKFFENSANKQNSKKKKKKEKKLLNRSRSRSNSLLEESENKKSIKNKGKAKDKNKNIDKDKDKNKNKNKEKEKDKNKNKKKDKMTKISKNQIFDIDLILEKDNRKTHSRNYHL